MWENVEWQPSSDGLSTSVYERQQMTWSFAGNDIQNLEGSSDATMGNPMNMNVISVSGIFPFTSVMNVF